MYAVLKYNILISFAMIGKEKHVLQIYGVEVKNLNNAQVKKEKKIEIMKTTWLMNIYCKLRSRLPIKCRWNT